ncbi:MAG TPA: peptidylprolyl isomerase [Clostridia bacterium]|nr:peptidylprolyl isomerase [Clostridia bacterium]
MKKSLILIISICVLFLTACGTSKENTTSPESSQTSNNSSNKITPSKNESSKEVSYQFTPPKKGDEIAIIKTSLGDITIRFFPSESPKAVENFIEHSKKNYYNGLLFHRVINNFMIQTGDPKGDGTGGESIWSKPFEDELSEKLHYFRGAVAMANSGANTNGSQFFIVQNPTVDNTYEQMMTYNNFSKELLNQYKMKGGSPHLEPGFCNPNSGNITTGYSIFGQVIDGLDVVDKIASVTVDNSYKPQSDVKMQEVVIKKFN